MTISNNYSPDKSSGDGSTVEFSGSWKVLSASYFRLYFENKTTGELDLKELGVDYTLSFDDDGYVADFTISAAPPSTVNVIRSREIAQDQTDPYRTSKGFQGQVIENAFDKLTAIDQDQQDGIDRSLKFSVALSGTITDAELPTPVDGYGIIWDGVAGRLRNTDSSMAILEGNAAIVADDIANIDTVADDIASVNIVAADLSGDDDIGTVAANIASVVSVAANISDVNSIVTNMADINAVEDALADIETCADNIAAIQDAPNQAAAAAASAAEAAAAAAEGLYNNVISLTFADSPYVPSAVQEGTLFKVDTSGGAFVFNLSALSVYGEDMKFAFVKEAGASDITVNRGGADTINGETSITLSTVYEVHSLAGDDDTGSWIDIVQTTGIPDNAVTNTKLANMAQATIKGRSSGSGTGDPQDLTAAQAREVLDVYSVSDTNTALSGKVSSDPSGVAGADAVLNIMALTTAEYTAIGTPDASTIYYITDA